MMLRYVKLPAIATGYTSLIQHGRTIHQEPFQASKSCAEMNAPICFTVEHAGSVLALEGFALAHKVKMANYGCKRGFFVGTWSPSLRRSLTSQHIKFKHPKKLRPNA